VLPLLAEHLGGRRTLLDLLRFADAHELNWLGVDPDPATEATNTRYRISRSHGDLYPPDACWRPATVTSPAVAGHRYPVLVADGYTARGGVLARFAADQVARMSEDLSRPHIGVDDTDLPWIQRLHHTVIISAEVSDAEGGPRWIEQDVVYADADGCYAIGAYQWQWVYVCDPATGR
jgi:hypothetical protein